MRVLSAFGVDWSVLVSEEMLLTAKMPNIYSGPLPVKFHGKNGNVISAVDFLRGNSNVESNGKDGMMRKTLGGSDTPSKRAKLSDSMIKEEDDDDEFLATIIAKSPPQESLPQSATPKKSVEFSASLPPSTSEERIAAVELAFAALEQVKFGYKDVDSELVEALKLAEKYQQGLNAEVEKNRVLQEALEKSKREASRLEEECGS